MTRFFCPGRVELAGSHTGQQRGRIMAAAMDRGITAEAEPNDEGVVRIFCEGFEPIEVDLSRLWPDEHEKGRPSALVRGMAASLAETIPGLRGFDAYLFSDLPAGRGFSSSSTLCVLTGYMLAAFSGAEAAPEELARAAQKAVNRWFGKVCSLVDPLACAMGGGVYLDALENKIVPIACDFDGLGLALCLTDTGEKTIPRADRNSVGADMSAVAKTFGEPVLARVRATAFDEQYPAHQNDPQWIRARHFFDETWRVSSMADALGLRDGQRYMDLMNQSGRSAERILRTISPAGWGENLAKGLEASGTALAGRGAWRPHRGGFAGYILALAPEEHYELYQTAMDRLFGEGACRRIHVSERGVCLAQDDKALFADRRFPEEAASLLGY